MSASKKDYGVLSYVAVQVWSDSWYTDYETWLQFGLNQGSYGPWEFLFTIWALICFQLFLISVIVLALQFFFNPCFNSLKTKCKLLYLKPQSIPCCKHFSLGYKNQSVYAVSGTSRCLFSDKYKTHKYSVGRAYNCWMLIVDASHNQWALKG